MLDLGLLHIFHPCIVDGHWSQWGTWMPCTVTCGNGTQDRSRSCDNPKPLYGGQNCYGVPVQTMNCIKKPCPGLSNILMMHPKVHVVT